MQLCPLAIGRPPHAMTKAERKCKNPDCGRPYRPFSTTQKACSLACSLVVGRKDLNRRRERKRKDEARETRRKREALKTKPQLTREAQTEFNAWVRERDHDLPCVSCGDFPSGAGSRGGLWDCGHYLGTGSTPELRFEPDNAHKQCKQCNQHLSGNVAKYRIGLLERIGPERLAWLEGPHELPHWTHDELRAIRDKYRAKARELRKER